MAAKNEKTRCTKNAKRVFLWPYLRSFGANVVPILLPGFLTGAHRVQLAGLGFIHRRDLAVFVGVGFAGFDGCGCRSRPGGRYRLVIPVGGNCDVCAACGGILYGLTVGGKCGKEENENCDCVFHAKKI